MSDREIGGTRGKEGYIPILDSWTTNNPYGQSGYPDVG